MPPGRPVCPPPHESTVIHRPPFPARLSPSGGGVSATPSAALRPPSVLPGHKPFPPFALRPSRTIRMALVMSITVQDHPVMK